MDRSHHSGGPADLACGQQMLLAPQAKDELRQPAVGGSCSNNICPAANHAGTEPSEPNKRGPTAEGVPTGPQGDCGSAGSARTIVPARITKGERHALDRSRHWELSPSQEYKAERTIGPMRRHLVVQLPSRAQGHAPRPLCCVQALPHGLLRPEKPVRTVDRAIFGRRGCAADDAGDAAGRESALIMLSALSLWSKGAAQALAIHPRPIKAARPPLPLGEHVAGARDPASAGLRLLGGRDLEDDIPPRCPWWGTRERLAAPPYEKSQSQNGPASGRGPPAPSCAGEQERRGRAAEEWIDGHPARAEWGSLRSPFTVAASVAVASVAAASVMASGVAQNGTHIRSDRSTKSVASCAASAPAPPRGRASVVWTSACASDTLLRRPALRL